MQLPRPSLYSSERAGDKAVLAYGTRSATEQKVMKYRARLKLMRLLLFIVVFCSAVTFTAVQIPAQIQSSTSSAFDQVLTLLTQSHAKFAAAQIDEAISLAERALKLAEKELGPEHGAAVLSLATLAQLYDQKSDYDRAELFYQRALVIVEKPNSGLEPSFLATLLDGLGRVYDLKGDFARAEPLYKRALAIQEKTLGPEDAAVATTLTNLGALYQTKADYGAAEPLLQR